MTNVETPLTLQNLLFFRLRYLLIGYPIDKLPSKPTRLIMPLGQSSQSPFPMEKYTLKHTIHAHSPNPNSIMTPTTKNFSRSSRLSQIGAIIWKDLLCPLMWSPTIKTWYIFPQLNS